MKQRLLKLSVWVSYKHEEWTDKNHCCYLVFMDFKKRLGVPVQVEKELIVGSRFRSKMFLLNEKRTYFELDITRLWTHKIQIIRNILYLQVTPIYRHILCLNMTIYFESLSWSKSRINWEQWFLTVHSSHVVREPN